MKKRLLLFSFYLIQVLFVFPQAIKDRGSVSILVGPAFATGKFSSTDIYDKSSGFAKVGESGSVSYSKFLSNNWGILVDILGQRNPLNTTAFENTFSQLKLYQGITFGSDPNNPPPAPYSIYKDWSFEKRAWLYGALLAGVERRFAGNTKKFQFVVKAMAGIVYAQSPGLKGSSITDTASAQIVQGKNSAVRFIYTVAGALNYDLNKSLFISAALRYVATNKMTFKNVKTTLTTTNGNINSPGYTIAQSVTTGNSQQIISSVNLSVGIGIRL